MKHKDKKVDFSDFSDFYVLGTLGTSLLGNLSTGKSTIRAGKRTIRAD